jgi:hypothetical protein
MVTKFCSERKPAKETSDKEKLIDDVFQEIQAGPFDELRDADIRSAFEQAKSSDFEVCVVAPMSAGKSTLINAMLGTKLMPSKLEACTAIITRIKDSLDGADHWEAQVYDKQGCQIETYSRLDLKTMERLNGDDQVSEIRMNGDIPFVSSDDVSLVLVDTPGPNNARDPKHRQVQSDFLSRSSKALVLYVMTGEFGSDDDNRLLQQVAESMSVGGKQSRDRFLFVVNKIDARKEEDGATKETLDKIRAYLRNHGIERANIFPAAALPALDIRLVQNGAAVDEDTKWETDFLVGKLNRKETLHCEAYAPLPASLRGEINDKLSQAAADETGMSEALIHTGVVSIEAAIRQYVLKYAKTAKVKNIVDTFIHKLEEVGCFEETKNELVKNRAEKDEIVGQIKRIKQRVNDTKKAIAFENKVNDAILRVDQNSKKRIAQIVKQYQERLSQRLDRLRGQEISVDEAEKQAQDMKRFALNLEPEFQKNLEILINETVTDTCNALLREYCDRLASLADEEGADGLFGTHIDPFQLMSGSHFSVDGISVNNLVQNKRVEDGSEWVKNTNKKWYKPWTWFQESGYYRTKYKNVQYVKADDLILEFLAPIKAGLWSCGDEASKFAQKQSKNIVDSFTKEFKRLDDQLKAKLDLLEDYATQEDKVEARIAETERRLNWLEEIKAKVESILEI